MSRFKPVHLPPDRVPQGAVSMTALRHYQACPRSGYLYLLYRGIAQSAEMARGQAAHEVFERGTQLMIEQGEPMVPGDLMKTIVDEVLAEVPVPWVEHDYIREMAFRWAEQTTVNPQRTLGVEQLVELPVGDWRLRCKLDYVELSEDGLSVRVDDYKTARGAPSYDDIGRKRPDEEGIAAKDFQLVVYALAAAYGTPLRVEPCGDCHGTGYLREIDLRGMDGDAVDRALDAASGAGNPPCDYCDGRGHVEIPEPFPLAAQAQRFDLRLVFPGIETADGSMAVRSLSLTPLELSEYRASLEAVLTRFEGSLGSGDWPAVESAGACKECPARRECPIPREVRSHAGRINDVADLREASEVWERVADEQSALRSEIKKFMEGHDLVEVRYGGSRAWRFVWSESETIKDKAALWEAIERAVEFGEPFEKSKYVRTSDSTNLKAVELTPEEISEQEAVDG